MLDAPFNSGAPATVGLLNAKFVRYPGCQQLILWLPQSGYENYGALRIFGPNDALIEDQPVRSRLNGSVQILTDTFGWAPGDYRVEISHDDGWRHELRLRKLEEGVAPPAPPAPPPEPRSEDPIVYRDGFGKEIPNVDLEMREELNTRLVQRFNRRLEFEGNARAGVVIYIDGDTRIRFSHEMCIGRVNMSIDLPRAAHWEAHTGTPLSARDDIVEFVARETQRTQASTWDYEIHGDRIDFVS